MKHSALFDTFWCSFVQALIQINVFLLSSSVVKTKNLFDLRKQGI